MDAMYIVITDGNRIVGVDQDVKVEEKANDSVRELLRCNSFHFLPGTVTVNGVNITPFTDDALNFPFTLVHRLTLRGKPYTNRMRIVCKTPKDDPSKLTWRQLAELKAKRKQTVSEENRVMYICNDCKKVFLEYNIRTEREFHHEFLPDIVWEDLHFPICPECGSEDFEEACECLYCGEGKRHEDMLTDEICRKCFTELSEQRKDLVNGFLTENAEDFAEYCAEKLKEETA